MSVVFMSESNLMYGNSETEIPATPGPATDSQMSGIFSGASLGNTVNSSTINNTTTTITTTTNHNNAMNFFNNGPSSNNHRPNYILGGVDRQVDETSEKLRENFLAFLERYRESSSNFAASEIATTSSTLGTSEMLLSTTQGSEPAHFAENNPLYRQQLGELRNEGLNTIYVDFNHLYRFDDVLANAIAENFYR